MDLIRRTRQTDARETCGHCFLDTPCPFLLKHSRLDTCLTSLFSGSWMCRRCGWELCDLCHDDNNVLSLSATVGQQSTYLYFPA
jgi:lysine-specific demethylase 3